MRNGLALLLATPRSSVAVVLFGCSMITCVAPKMPDRKATVVRKHCVQQRAASTSFPVSVLSQTVKQPGVGTASNGGDYNYTLPTFIGVTHGSMSTGGELSAELPFSQLAFAAVLRFLQARASLRSVAPTSRSRGS